MLQFTIISLPACLNLCFLVAVNPWFALQCSLASVALLLVIDLCSKSAQTDGLQSFSYIYPLPDPGPAGVTSKYPVKLVTHSSM